MRIISYRGHLNEKLSCSKVTALQELKGRISDDTVTVIQDKFQSAW
jgi:hypothetical protein